MRIQSLALLVLAFAVEPIQAASYFTGAGAPGPPAVGLRVVQQYDYARAYRGTYDHVTGKLVTGERARPIQSLVWYPAQGGGKMFTWGVYLRLGANDEQFGASA